jgi:hypothetical protein
LQALKSAEMATPANFKRIFQFPKPDYPAPEIIKYDSRPVNGCCICRWPRRQSAPGRRQKCGGF